MAESASDYHHGDMNITEQVRTFELFNGLTKWGSLTVATLLVMLVLWFCVGAGFLAASGVSATRVSPAWRSLVTATTAMIPPWRTGQVPTALTLGSDSQPCPAQDAQEARWPRRGRQPPAGAPLVAPGGATRTKL